MTNLVLVPALEAGEENVPRGCPQCTRRPQPDVRPVLGHAAQAFEYGVIGLAS